MTEKRNNGHLEPEDFVDLLDGAPVEASKRQHLESCADCRAELDEIESTLSLLRGESLESPSTGARSASRPLRKRERSFLPWLAAAAALLFAGATLYWTFSTSERSPIPYTATESLLPPVEEDEEFKLLLALSHAVEEEWAPEESAPFGAEATLDLEELTPAERQRFVQELAEEMRSSSL